MSDEGKSLFQQGYDDAVDREPAADDSEEYLVGYTVGTVEREQRDRGGWPRELFWNKVGQLANERGQEPESFADHVFVGHWDDFMEGYNGTDDEGEPEEDGDN